MPNTIRHKRGTTVPTPSVLQTGEIAINTTNGFAYTKTDAGSVVQIGQSPDLSGYAPLASPALSGVPTAPTPLASDNSTTIATTAYVTNAIASSTTSPSTQKVTKTVRNATASLIPKRSVVYINGANGNNATIALAQANAESTSYRTFGITESDIAINGDGIVVIIGEVLNVDTGSFNDGDQLYLSPTIAGGVTNVKPSAPNHMVYVGVVTRANDNNGKIEVNIANGFELHELHDVAIATKVDNQLIAYEQSTNLWKNKSAASLGIAELSGATFTGKVTTTATATTAPLNITPAAIPSATVNGDIWIGPTSNALSVRGTDGATRQTAMTGSQQTFTQPQIIATVTSATLPALRITNLSTTGTAHSLVVEDSTNPDASSFVINTEGRVGIGVIPSSFTGASGAKVRVEGEVECNINTSPCISNQILATTSYVKNSVVPNVIEATDGSYYSYTNNGTSPMLWNTIVKCNSYSEVNMEIPTEANIGGVVIGTQIVFIQTGSGQLNFSQNSVQILSSGNKYKTSGLFAVVTAIKTGADEWLIAGDLVA